MLKRKKIKTERNVLKSCEEDIFSVKRRFFTDFREQTLRDFSNTWYVSLDELHSSAIQYIIGAEPIPNIGSIIDSADFAEYKLLNLDAKKLKYYPEMKRKWQSVLDKIVIPLDDELK